MSEIHEECGVFGIYSNEKKDLAAKVYSGLFALQHRGQESCGITINDDGVLSTYKDNGTVSDVFTFENLKSVGEGNIGLGHVRDGSDSDEKDRLMAQPIVVNHIKGRMAISHNGNIVNAYELREELEMGGSIFHTISDAELISHVITKARIESKSIEEAINKSMDKIDGAFSLAIMSATKLIAVRDPHGFRPLCYGQTEDGDYVIASESCALDAVGATFIRDVRPGEILIINKKGVRSITDHCDKVRPSMCVFEYIYFSRPDSVIDGNSVHEARLRAGSFLALEHPVQADIVIGVPDSGIDAAIGYSRQSGIPYGIGFIKNKYIGRTFISPGQKSRENLVKIKLNPIAQVVKGKRVVLIDDSIVRGTTSKYIVGMLRAAGATEVHMRVSSPPFLNPCHYGTDIESRDALIACHYSTEEIAEIIGADSLGYLNVKNVCMLASSGETQNYCSACFDGNYPTDEPLHNCKYKYHGKLHEKTEKKESNING